MKTYYKVQFVIKKFLSSKNKIAFFGKTFRILKNYGVSGLSMTFKSIEQEKEKPKDLYSKQQSEKKEYLENEVSILFVILALHNEVDIRDTYRLTKQLLKDQDRLVVIKDFQRAEWEADIKCELFTCTMPNVYACVQNLLKESKQEYVYFIKGGNFLAANMRNEFAEIIAKKQPDIVYSDECVFAFDSGEIVRYDLKPDFSIYDLFQGNQSWQSVMFSKTLVMTITEVSPYPECIENMIFYLMLMSISKTKKITHISQVLLLKKDILEERNLEERRGILALCLKDSGILSNVILEKNYLKICKCYQQYKISIVVIANDFHNIQNCIRSILNFTADVDYEIFIVGEENLLSELKKHFRLQDCINYIVATSQMTYAQKCNTAAAQISGDILLFMQEDLQINYSLWLSKILDVFIFPWVGAASPKIVRQDNTIRYAGMIAGGFGFTAIPFNGEPNCYHKNINEPAFFNRQVSVLSASCIAIRQSVFKKIGGFDDANFDDKFSNAQLSFSVSHLGYACIYCADSILVSKSDDWYDSWYDKEHSSAYLNILMNYGQDLSEDMYFTDSMKYLYLRGVPIDFRIYQK